MKKNKLKHLALSFVIGLSITGVSLAAPVSVAFADDGNKGLAGNGISSQMPEFEISEIIFTPDTASPGDTVRVRALTNGNDSDIFSVMLVIPVNDKKTEHIYLTHGENDVLEGSFTIGDNWANGIHTVSSVQVTATDQTVSDYDTTLTEVGSFRVENSSENFDQPVLNSVTYDKNEFRMGEAVTITVDVTHATDIEELIVTFTDEGNQSHSVSFENGNTVHTKDLSGWDEGVYHVSSVFIRDKAGNREYYEENYNLDEVELSEFTISNDYDDIQGPVVTSVTFDKETVNPGEYGDFVTITADAHDSTGVSFLAVDVTNHKGETECYYLYDNGEGCFTAQIFVDNSFLNGEHNITHISAYDVLNNESEFVPGDDTKDLIAGSFTVEGSLQDRESPAIKKVEIRRHRLKPGESSTILFTLSDKSDIWNAMVNLYRKDTNELFASAQGVLQKDGSYICEFTVTDQWYNGEYDIRILSADSMQNIGNEPVGISLFVTGSNEDHYAPVINSVTSDKTEVKPGDVVSVTAEVNDDNNINYVLGGLFFNGERLTDEYGDEILFPFTRNANGLFQYLFRITDNWLNGKYELLLNTNDEFNNFEDDIDTGIAFTVSDSLEHREGHHITSILFDKTECVPGDTFTMTAVAEDDLDQIEKIEIVLEASDDTHTEQYNPHLYFTLYPDENGTFSAMEIVDNTWIDNTYEVVNVIITDSLGNKEYFNDDLLTELYLNKELELNFLTVTGSRNEASRLHVSKIMFDKETVNIGETINITATTTGEGKAKELVLELTDESYDRVVRHDKVYIEADDDGNLKGSIRIDPNDSYWQKDLSYSVVSVLLLDTENNSRYYGFGFDAEFMEDLRDIEINSFTVDTYAEPEILPADYSEVDAAIASIPENLNIYEQEGINALNKTLSAVERDKTELEQVLVNSYAKAIRKAIENLVEKPADYSKVDNALAAVPGNLDIYTEKSVKALNKAISAIKKNLLLTEQETVDGFADSVNNAVNALVLKTADYSAVDGAKSGVPEDLTIYTEVSVNDLNDALNAVVSGLNITQQEQVDKYAADIHAAINRLNLKNADYTETDTALRGVPEDLSIYTDDSVTALRDIIDAVVRNKPVTEQDTVNGYAESIRAAIDDLVIKPADYSAVETAKSKIPGDLSLYTEDSVSILNETISAVVDGLDITGQSRVDTFAADIVKAIEDLKYKEANYGNVDKAIAAVPSDLGNYTEESVGLLKQALEKVERGLGVNEQERVDIFASDIEEAVKKLVKKEKAAEPEPEPKNEPAPAPAAPTAAEPVKKQIVKIASAPAAAAVKTTTPVSAPAKETPKTGDKNNAALWGAISGASLAGIGTAAVVIKRRRRKQ